MPVLARACFACAECLNNYSIPLTILAPLRHFRLPGQLPPWIHRPPSSPAVALAPSVPAAPRSRGHDSMDWYQQVGHFPWLSGHGRSDGQLSDTEWTNGGTPITDTIWACPNTSWEDSGPSWIGEALKTAKTDDLEKILRVGIDAGDWKGESYLPESMKEPMKVTPSVTQWYGGWDSWGNEDIPDADEIKRAADQRIPDTDDTAYNPYANPNSTKADHLVPVAEDDCTTHSEDLIDFDVVQVDVPDGKQQCWDVETQSVGKIIHGDQRRGSGKKKLSGRFGQRGGTRNPNVQWHSLKAQAQREGWMYHFRQAYPKPLKEASQWYS